MRVFVLTLYDVMKHSFQAEETSSEVASTSASRAYSEHGLTCVAWNDCIFEPAKLAVGGYSKKVSVWTFDTTDGNNGRWREVATVSIG
jgi:hypothetical protein